MSRNTWALRTMWDTNAKKTAKDRVWKIRQVHWNSDVNFCCFYIYTVSGSDAWTVEVFMGNFRFRDESSGMTNAYRETYVHILMTISITVTTTQTQNNG
jgi:hypothetical protein